MVCFCGYRHPTLKVFIHTVLVQPDMKVTQPDCKHNNSYAPLSLKLSVSLYFVLDWKLPHFKASKHLGQNLLSDFPSCCWHIKFSFSVAGTADILQTLFGCVSLTLSRKIMAFIWNKHAHLLADSEPKPISCWLPPLWVPGSLPVLNFHSLNNNMRTETIKTSICITFCTECFGFKQEIPHLTHNLLKAVTMSCHGKYVESELKQVFRNQSFTAQYLHLSFQSV